MCVYPFLPRAVWDQWKDHFDHYDFSLTLLVVAILVYKEHEQEVTRFQVTSAYWNDLIWQILTSFLRIGEWQGVRLIPPCTTDEWCLLWLQFRKHSVSQTSQLLPENRRLGCAVYLSPSLAVLQLFPAALSFGLIMWLLMILPVPWDIYLLLFYYVLPNLNLF